jgi:hypothetical protein
MTRITQDQPTEAMRCAEEERLREELADLAEVGLTVHLTIPVPQPGEDGDGAGCERHAPQD